MNKNQIAVQLLEDIVEDACEQAAPEKAFGKGYKPGPCATSADSLYHSISILRGMGDVGCEPHTRMGLRNMAVKWLERDFSPEWMEHEMVESTRQENLRLDGGYDLGASRRMEMLPTDPKTKPKFVRDLYGEEPRDIYSYGMERAFDQMQQERRTWKMPDIHWFEEKTALTKAKMRGKNGLVYWFCQQARQTRNPATLLEVEALAYCLPEKRPIHVHYRRKGKVVTLKLGPQLYKNRKPLHLIWSGDQAMRFQPAIPTDKMEKAAEVAARMRGTHPDDSDDRCPWDFTHLRKKRERERDERLERRKYTKVQIKMRACFDHDWHKNHLIYARDYKPDDWSPTVYEKAGVTWLALHNIINTWLEDNDCRKLTAQELAPLVEKDIETAHALLAEYDADDPYLHSGF